MVGFSCFPGAGGVTLKEKRTMDKQKLSRFEYAIYSVASPETIDQYEAYTEQEEMKMRADKIKKQLSRFTIIEPAPPTGAQTTEG